MIEFNSGSILTANVEGQKYTIMVVHLGSSTKKAIMDLQDGYVWACHETDGEVTEEYLDKHNIKVLHVHKKT